MHETVEVVRRRPAPALRPLIAEYIGYREAGLPPRRHRGLPSPYPTLIITLHEPLVIAAHPDRRTPPGTYDTLIGGLHTVPREFGALAGCPPSRWLAEEFQAPKRPSHLPGPAADSLP